MQCKKKCIKAIKSDGINYDGINMRNYDGINMRYYDETNMRNYDEINI